jgi:type IV secretion system protein VirB10
VLLVERGSHMDGEYRIASVRPGTVRIPSPDAHPDAARVTVESSRSAPLGESGRTVCR